MQTVILFYTYTNITYPKRILKWQQKICTDLTLKGRILIAQEGINGTLSGSPASVKRYVEIMHNHKQFSDIAFKYSTADGDCFPRLQVTVKPEIVRLCVDKKDAPLEHGGVHLTPEQTHAMLSNKSDTLIVLDARNTFESDIGTFKGAVKAPIKHFRDLPKYIDKHIDQFKNKEVLMFCTGGVRCERATAYLKKKHVAQEVYQMDGGIHNYVEQYPDGYFRGKNYVFDSRITVKVNDDILGSCFLCKTPCDNYINCANALCNKHVICCTKCIKAYNDTCSKKCLELVTTKKVNRRPALVKAKAA